MHALLKSRKFLIGSAAALALIAFVTVVCILTTHEGRSTIARAGSSGNSSTNIEAPAIAKADENVTSGSPNSVGVSQLSLDVAGSPSGSAAASASGNKQYTGGVNGSSSGKGGTAASSKNKPSVSVSVTPHGTQSKSTSPTPSKSTGSNYPTNPDGWTPPPPGQGTGSLISSGAESIPINPDSSVETLQCDLGLQVGSNLLQAGYNTLYPNGCPEKMVEDAIKVYADIGKISFNPSKYGLPKLVGYYNAKIPAKGPNVSVAGNYIASYIENDATFKSDLKTIFSVYKDGWLSVYQKGGYFYILFAVVDKGYSNLG